MVRPIATTRVNAPRTRPVFLFTAPVLLREMADSAACTSQDLVHSPAFVEDPGSRLLHFPGPSQRCRWAANADGADLPFRSLSRLRVPPWVGSAGFYRSSPRRSRP